MQPMLHLRLIVPNDVVPSVLAMLRDAPEVTNLWHVPGAAVEPAGDLMSCDVAKEEGSRILQRLRGLGLDRRGSIAVEAVDVSISDVARDAERAAPGSPADAVVWEEVESRLSESAVLSVSFLLLITIATMIAAIGIITDSIVLIIGAMVVGPEYGPLAGICVALSEGRPRLAGRSFRALAIGFPVAIVLAALLTLSLVGTGIAPATLLPTEHELTLFISQPNWYSLIVAFLAGTAGMLALVSAKSGALIGVLISVTTIPAAANVGVAVAYGVWGDALRAAGHLGINIGAILATGLAVIRVAQRARRARPQPSPSAGTAGDAHRMPSPD
jgi:uncharacterized hydrophobic protein (TIGR00271 family)